MESKKIIHVHLKDPAEDGRQDFYFGSLRAIYGTLTKEHIGRSYASLTASSIYKNGGVFENRNCVIRISEIARNRRNKDLPENGKAAQ